MKLMVWLVMWGLVSVTCVQANSQEFLTVDDETDSHDLNVTEIEAMQESRDNNTNPDMVRHRMQRGNLTSMRSDLGSNNTNLMFTSEQMEDRDMFPSSRNSLSNEEVNRTASSSESAQAFHCDHRNYRLRWFPHTEGSAKYICYVPWASNQDIVYAKCLDRHCMRFNYNDGDCRPACHCRRVIAALCYKRPQHGSSSSSWTWRILVRNLPRTCVCSSRFSFKNYVTHRRS